MEKDVEDGGVNMINLHLMQSSFYLQWAGTLYDKKHDNWAEIPQWEYRKIATELNAFEINVNKDNHVILEKINSPFWKNVLATHYKYKKYLFSNKVNNNNIKDQFLWYNQDLKYRNKELYFKRWHKGGIERMHHILNTDNTRILNYNEIAEKIGNTAQLQFEYYAIINALPRDWKALIRMGNLNTTENDTHVLCYYKKKAKSIRLELQAKSANNNKPCSHNFWINKLGLELTDKIWGLAKDVTREIRLKELNWKILHNIYPTNIMLHKMKHRTNNKCCLCPNKIDFVEHFFYECFKVKQFWNYIEYYIQRKKEQDPH